MLRTDQLAPAYWRIDQLLEESEGEVTPEVERLQAELDDALPDRVDQTRHVLRRLDVKAEVLRGEIRALNDLVAETRKALQAVEARQARWKGWLLAALEAAGVDSARGHLFKVSRVPSTPRVEVDWVGALPEGYTRVTVEPDRARLLEDYKAGRPLPEGVRVVRGHYPRFS